MTDQTTQPGTHDFTNRYVVVDVTEDTLADRDTVRKAREAIEAMREKGDE